jgi:hypothetical protein
MGFTPGLSHFRLLHPGFARFALGGYPNSGVFRFTRSPLFTRVLPVLPFTHFIRVSQGFYPISTPLYPGFTPFLANPGLPIFTNNFLYPPVLILGNLGKPRLAGTRSTGMAGLGMFYQKSAIAVTMPIVTAFKFCICIGHRKNELLNR